MSNSIINLISPTLLSAVEFDKTYFPIPIIESNEKLVDIEPLLTSQSTVVFNQEPTSTGQKRLFVFRQGLVFPLIQVAKELNSLGYQLRFEYVYRRLEDQRAAFEQSVKTWLKKMPNESKETILEIAGIFVASTPDTAAHVSGAAIDVTLLTLDNKNVDLGASYLHPGPESATLFPDLSSEVKKNRALLCEVMEKYGFANYPYEFWHFCQGDKIEARVHKKDHAIYGPVQYSPETQTFTKVSNANQPFDVEKLFINKNLSK